MLNQVVMVLMLFAADGTPTLGVVPYDSYESCWSSLAHSVDAKRYPISERVCMQADYFDSIRATITSR